MKPIALVGRYADIGTITNAGIRFKRPLTHRNQLFTLPKTVFPIDNQSRS